MRTANSKFFLGAPYLYIYSYTYGCEEKIKENYVADHVAFHGYDEKFLHRKTDRLKQR